MIAGLSIIPLAQADAAAAAAAPPPASSGLAFWLILLAAMALAPFVLTMVTSFAKLVVVGGILRHAMGTQQIPPNTVITGLALILSVHIMSPVALRIYGNYVRAQEAAANQPPPSASELVRRSTVSAEVPMREFLERHSHPENVRMFEDLRNRLQMTNRAEDSNALAERADPLIRQLIYDLTVLTPAFMLSQLTEAFQIGFLLFIPFLIIDLVVSNVLMAMGMQMMSPVTVSMPLKLLLFVLVDGWRLIMRGLVLGYT